MQLLFAVSILFICFHSIQSATNFTDIIITHAKEVEVDGYTFDKLFVVKKSAVKTDFRSYEEISEENIKFFKDDEEQHIQKDYGSRHYVINGIWLSLIFEKGDARYSGNWEVELNGINITKSIHTDKPIFEYMRETKRFSENETVVLECPTIGMFHVVPQITWTYSEDRENFVPVSSNAKYSEHNRIPRSVLTIENMKEDQAGLYKCSNGFDQNVFLVKVKNKNRVYWPLIGIAIEIIILVVTIAIYEKHQSSKRKERAKEEMEATKMNVDAASSNTNSNAVRI